MKPLISLWIYHFDLDFAKFDLILKLNLLLIIPSNKYTDIALYFYSNSMDGTNLGEPLTYNQPFYICSGGVSITCCMF